MVQEVGRLFGNLSEGIARPLLGSPQPLWYGRKGAACNPRGQVWGLPSREMKRLAPSFSARVQWSLTSS